MGIANIINTSTSSGGGGGEIIRELVNSSDGQGLYFSNTGYIHLANNAAVEFGTSDFSIEFILNQTGEAGTSGGSIYQSATTVNNKFSIENHVNSNVVKLIFFNAVGAASQYDLPYNMAADYNEPTHYVVSCDRSGNAVLYRNGTEVASVSIAASASTNLGDGVTSTAMIGNSGSGYTFLGGLYRFRTWNKALSHDEVDTCFQRADVPFESQYGSETDLVTNGTFTGGTTGWNLTSVTYGTNNVVWAAAGGWAYIRQASWNITVGKKYRISFDISGHSANGVLQLWDYGGANTIATLPEITGNGTITHEFTALKSSSSGVILGKVGNTFVGTMDNVSCVAIGVLTDHDLAFANPTQSAMCQDRAGNSDGTMGGTIEQTQKIVQLNAVAARIGTSAATPADGDLIVGNDIGLGIPPAVRLHINDNGTASYSTSAAPTAQIKIDTSGNTNSAYTSMMLGSRGSSGTGRGVYLTAVPDGDGDNALAVSTADNYNTAERFRISAEGDVSINATGADQKRNLNIHGTNGSSEQQTFTIESDGENAKANFKLGIGGGAASTKMTITAAGDVSVNATTPKAKLHVKATGTNWEDSLLLEKSSGNTGWNFLPGNSGNNDLWIGYNANTAAALTSQAATTALAISSAGNVQIGTGTLAAVGGGPTLGICGAAPEITLRDSATNTPYAVMRTNDSGNLYLEADKGDNAGASKVVIGSDGADILSFKKETAYVTRGTQEQSAAIAHNTTTTFEAPANIFMIYDTAGYGAVFFNDYSEATVTKIAGASHFTTGGSGAIRLTTASNDSTVTVDNQQGGTRTIKILNLGN